MAATHVTISISRVRETGSKGSSINDVLSYQTQELYVMERYLDDGIGGMGWGVAPPEVIGVAQRPNRVVANLPERVKALNSLWGPAEIGRPLAGMKEGLRLMRDGVDGIRSGVRTAHIGRAALGSIMDAKSAVQTNDLRSPEEQVAAALAQISSGFETLTQSIDSFLRGSEQMAAQISSLTAITESATSANAGSINGVAAGLLTLTDLLTALYEGLDLYAAAGNLIREVDDLLERKDPQANRTIDLGYGVKLALNEAKLKVNNLRAGVSLSHALLTRIDRLARASPANIWAPEYISTLAYLEPSQTIRTVYQQLGAMGLPEIQSDLLAEISKLDPATTQFMKIYPLHGGGSVTVMLTVGNSRLGTGQEQLKQLANELRLADQVVVR